MPIRRPERCGESEAGGRKGKGTEPAVDAAGGGKTECGGSATSKTDPKWPYVEQMSQNCPFSNASRPLTEVLIENQSSDICRNS